MYVTENLALRAQRSPSPWLILRSLFRWAGLSVVGFFGLLGSFVGYFVSASFVLCALLKPFHPQTAGLWRIAMEGDTTYSLRLGFGAVPAGGIEILGWWIIPIGFAAAGAVFFCTSYFGLWCIRRFQRTAPAFAHRPLRGNS